MPGLPAQQQVPRQPTFRSGVELVQVDVVVVDKDGRHVRGLKAADFAVLDRVKPQTIATFDEVSHERPREAAIDPILTRPARLDVGNNRTARSDRLVVMVVDDLHIYKGRTERARDIARQIVSHSSRQGARRDARAPFAPSLDRTFTPADTLRLYFEVARRSPAAVVQTKVEILDAQDDVRAWVDRQIPANDRGRVDVKLPLSTLTPGAYRLRMTAGDGASTSAREVGIVVE